jgi:hypothetical protein
MLFSRLLHVRMVICIRMLGSGRVKVCVYNYIDHPNLTRLIKWVKLFNYDPLILYWVYVEFVSHVKNCQPLCHMSGSSRVEIYV